MEVITSPERTETLKSIVGKFEAANPGTKVEIISLPWGEAFQKFATMVSAGELPDVVEMPDTWLSLYANNGLLESLEPYLAKWEHTAGLTDRALELGRDVDEHRLHAALRLLSAGDVLQQEAVPGGRRRRAAEDAWTSSAPPPRRSPSCRASTATACAAARAASTAG